MLFRPAAGVLQIVTLLPDAEITSQDLHGYRIFLFSHDHPHPPHVHVGKGKRYSSWDLTNTVCVDRDGFSPTEIRTQRIILVKYHEAIRRNWHAHWQLQH